jgi:hypothetical protein
MDAVTVGVYVVVTAVPTVKYKSGSVSKRTMQIRGYAKTYLFAMRKAGHSRHRHCNRCFP